MTYNPEAHHRRSIRLPNYDYDQPGAYFVTLCAMRRECVFSEIADGAVITSVFGSIAHDEWFRSADIRREVLLHVDEFVVMPNHIHGIVHIVCDVGATGRSPLLTMKQSGRLAHSVGAVIAGYKAAVTKRINQMRGTPGVPVWQRNYWEHVIRDESELGRIRAYIETNPAQWTTDRLHPAAQLGRLNQG